MGLAAGRGQAPFSLSTSRNPHPGAQAALLEGWGHRRSLGSTFPPSLVFLEVRAELRGWELL